MENPLTAFSQAFFTRHAIADDAFPSVERGRVTHNLNAAHPQDFSTFLFNASRTFLYFFAVISEKPEKVSMHSEGAFVRGLSNGNNSIIHTTVVVDNLLSGLRPLNMVMN